MDRIDLYLHSGAEKHYENTKREEEMVGKVETLFAMADSYKQDVPWANDKNLQKWRKAYQGTLNALDKRTGEESKRQSRQLRKMIYELIESKIDNTLPMPKIQPRHKNDIPVVDVTENYLKFEMDRMLSEQENDKSERATYIDGTSWYKVCWDSLDSTYDRSGDLRVEVLLADQVVPEPGCTDYRQMNYIFERKQMSISRIYDLYGRLMTSTDNSNTVEVISYYYKNKNGVIGRFQYASASGQVVSWDEDWQVRRVRRCSTCGEINPVGDSCKNCGGTTFRYRNAETEILSEDLVRMPDPYDVQEAEQNGQQAPEPKVFLKAGTEIPFYRIRQLPFVPRLSISSLDTMYGVSEVSVLLEMQDSVNKIWTKVEEKILKSGTLVTKPERMKLNDQDDTFKIAGVKTQEEAAMVQSKEIAANIVQDVNFAQMIYDSGRASSGVTNSFQGKQDTTATSGKAKEINAAQTAGRLESLRVMKAAAFAGVYELMLKYLLAFSDETRHYVRVLPDGSETEMLWSKYMFLKKDEYGNVYYNDDFAFSTDPAATLSNNRVQMWQETLQQFTMGTFGALNDPRTLELFWNIMDSMQYPLAKVVRAGIKENSQHLPPELEQALMQNPEILQQAAAMVQEASTDGRGGARPNSGPVGRGATHAASVNKTNNKNSMATEAGSSANEAQMTGGNI